MHMVGIQGWDMNSWSHSGSKSSSAPATHTVLTSIQGQLWEEGTSGGPFLPHCPQHSGADRSSGVSKARRQLELSPAGSAGPSWLPFLLDTCGCCWPRQMEAGGCRRGRPEDTPRGFAEGPPQAAPTMGFSPAPSIHHHCEGSNSGPELPFLCQSSLEQPQHLPLALPTPQFPPNPHSGHSCSADSSSAERGDLCSLWAFTQGWVRPCMDER